MIYTDAELKEKIHEMIRSFESEVVEFKEANNATLLKISASIFLLLEMKQLSGASQKAGLYLALPIKGNSKEPIIVRAGIFSH